MRFPWSPDPERKRATEALERCRVALITDDYDMATAALDEAESVSGAIRPQTIAYYRNLSAGER